MTTPVHFKVAGFKIYSSIPHLPGSKLGAGDKLGAGLTIRPGDTVWIQEKLDGSNVAVWRNKNTLVPLIRAGYPAASSRRSMHRLFARWAEHHHNILLDVLRPGERLVGEWLLLSHGTRYVLPHAPFVAFDLMTDRARIPFTELQTRLEGHFPTPFVYANRWAQPQQISLANGGHGAQDPPEGLIYRHERAGKVLAVRKWVRPDFQTSQYFAGEDAVLPNILRPEDQALLDTFAVELGITDFGGIHDLTENKSPIR